MKFSSEAQPYDDLENQKPEFDSTNLASLQAFAKKEALESAESYMVSLRKAIEAMEGGGGIVELKDTIPTIIISDLHARREMLVEILQQKTKEGQQIFQALKAGELQIVCVGDGLHSENMNLWDPATHPKYKETLNSLQKAFYDREQYLTEQHRAKPHFKEILNTDPELQRLGSELDIFHPEAVEKVLDEEINRSLGLMKMIMELKAAYPQHFHYIRGNHDDIGHQIGGQTKGGVEMSKLFFEWFISHSEFGDPFMQLYCDFEDRMPLVAKGNHFIVSHAAPALPLRKEEIKQWHQQPDPKAVAKALTWTENTYERVGRPSLADIQNNIRSIKSEFQLPGQAPFIIGHRPVIEGKYRSQFDGELIQINNSRQYAYMEVPADGVIDPERDVHLLDPTL